MLIAQSPKLPASQAAMDGTAQHAVIEHILLQGGKPQDFLGATVESVVIDDDMVKNVAVAYHSADELLKGYDPDFTFIEQRVVFDGERSFGTADVIAVDPDKKRALIADHKFGYVEVRPDNYQGRFIGATAIGDETVLDEESGLTLKQLLSGVETFDLAIIQPSFDPAHVVKTFPRNEFETFRATMALALSQATSPGAHVREGAHCKWCPAALICPAKLSRNADLIDLKKHAADWATAVPSILDIGDWFLPLHEQAKERAKHELENSRIVKGWNLKPGATNSKWIDVVGKNVIAALRGLGFKTDDIVKPITPAQTRKLVDKTDAATSKLLEEMILTSRNAPSLVKDGDPSAPALPAAAFKRAAVSMGASPAKQK